MQGHRNVWERRDYILNPSNFEKTITITIGGGADFAHNIALSHSRLLTVRRPYHVQTLLLPRHWEISGTWILAHLVFIMHYSDSGISSYE